MVALPLLESLPKLGGASELTRSRASADPSTRRRFAVFVRSGNGVQQAENGEPDRFWPTMTGPLTRDVLRDRDGGRAVSELADFASRLTIVRGLNRPYGTANCGHAESLPQVLTARNSTGGSGNEPLALGESADWRIARELQAPGTEPLVLMAGPNTAYIAEGLSWRGARDRSPAERSPARAFGRLMGLSSLPSEVQERIVTRRNSINDFVRAEMRELMTRPELSMRDRRRLEQHFDAIRDFELGMLCSPDPAINDRAAAITNVNANDVREDVVRSHMDVIAFAFSCGHTRAATLQIGEGNDQTQYFLRGTKLPRFHWISHRIESDGSDGTPIPNADLLHHEVDRIQLRLFRYLLTQLDRYESAYAGTLLDDTAAVWTNDNSGGPSHGGRNIPWIVAGTAGGFLRAAGYIDAGNTTTNRLLNTLLTAVGCTDGAGGPVEDFGDPSLTGGRLMPMVGSGPAT
jgi:hypothetical protein